MPVSFKEFIIAESLDEACWKNYTMVGMKKKDGREVPNCVPKKGVPKMRKEDAEDRPHPKGARIPLHGHPYHKKSEAELRYIRKDAGEAARAMKGHNPRAEAKYLDQVNDAETVLHYRSKGGKRVVEEVGQIDEALPPPDIRYSVNHGDNVAREHARGYKKAATAYNDAFAKVASQRRTLTREQEDELANHYERALHHQREFKKRLAQLAARKNEDLDEGIAAGKEQPEKPHPKGTRVVVSHKGHQKVGKVIRHDPGGPDSSPFYIVDVGEYGSHKVMAHNIRKEDLEDIYEGSAAWQRKEGKNPEGGLNRKGVESYRRENPGSKLQMAVTTKPSKLKPGSKAAKRRKSFCARMGGMEGPMKDEKGRPTRKALSLRKWNC